MVNRALTVLGWAVVVAWALYVAWRLLTIG